MPTLIRFLRHLFTGLVALVLLFEEWGWEPLAAVFARLARLPLWAALERLIARLPPWGAVAAFCLPALALLPVKLVALFLIGRGHPMLGLLVLLAAKLVGTALLARLFTLTQPALMQLRWFAYWWPRWKDWKDGVMAQVRRSAPWLAVRRFRKRLKARWVLLGRRWRRAP